MITATGAEMWREGDEDAQTLAGEAYRKIKRDIIQGRLAPGEPLRFEFLKDTYALSFSPLREALTRLQAERLVVASALKGYRVAALSVGEMWDTINTRVLIETAALRQSIAAGDDDWEAAVIAACHGLSRHDARMSAAAAPPSADAIDEMERRHRAFHYSLLAACPSRWLLDLSALLYMQTERYRRPVLARLGPKEGGRDLLDEHQALMTAALARDGDQAALLLTTHLKATGTAIERSGLTSSHPNGDRP